MLRIEIESTITNSRSGVSQRTGKPYTMVSQQALAYTDSSKHPDKIVIDLMDGERAHPVGNYILGDESFEPDKYKKLQLRRLVLVPIQLKASA